AASPVDACTQLGGITAGTSIDPLPGTYATVTNGRGPGPFVGDRGRLACATAVALVHRRSESYGGRPRPRRPSTGRHGGAWSDRGHRPAPATAVQRAPASATAVQRAPGLSYCQPPCNERPVSLPRGVQRNNRSRRGARAREGRRLRGAQGAPREGA